MAKSAKKQDSKLDGVKCVVNRCYFWGDGDCCMASQIEIRPRDASTSDDTDCETFFPK